MSGKQFAKEVIELLKEEAKSEKSANSMRLVKERGEDRRQAQINYDGSNRRQERRRGAEHSFSNPNDPSIKEYKDNYQRLYEEKVEATISRSDKVAYYVLLSSALLMITFIYGVGLSQ